MNHFNEHFINMVNFLYHKRILSMEDSEFIKDKILHCIMNKSILS